ncbi:MAG: hypothetical protein AAF870_08945 [Pseudomonadota bacterium]
MTIKQLLCSGLIGYNDKVSQALVDDGNGMMSSDSLSKQTAFVNGGSAGISKATALSFSEQGTATASYLASDAAKSVTRQALNMCGGTVLF